MCSDQHSARVTQAVATEIGEVIDYAENQNQRVGEDASFMASRTVGSDPPAAAPAAASKIARARNTLAG